MLQKRVCENGVVCLVSPLLERAAIPHAFSTRVGGVSQGPFASLNLGNPQGVLRDDEANIRENYARLLDAANLSGRPICRVHQVHGRTIVMVRHGDALPNHTQADALVTEEPEFALSIRTADCVPILIGEKSGRVVAAVHAGWRGVVAGIVPDTLSWMERMGIPAGDMLLAIGPCIGPDAFEVGEEVAELFSGSLWDDTILVRRPGAKPHVDLARAVALQAVRFGLSPEQINSTELCSVRDADLFFSHRREAGVTGRMASVISPRSPCDRMPA